MSEENISHDAEEIRFSRLFDVGRKIENCVTVFTIWDTPPKKESKLKHKNNSILFMNDATFFKQWRWRLFVLDESGTAEKNLRTHKNSAGKIMKSKSQEWRMKTEYNRKNELWSCSLCVIQWWPRHQDDVDDCEEIKQILWHVINILMLFSSSLCVSWTHFSL